MKLKVGIDVGGTFTDFLVTRPDDEPRVYKVLSTPSDPSVGLVDGLKEIAASVGMSLAQLARAGEPESEPLVGCQGGGRCGERGHFERKHLSDPLGRNVGASRVSGANPDPRNGATEDEPLIALQSLTSWLDRSPFLAC